MRFFWRHQAIRTYAEWRAEIAEKDDQPGRSAPTLATAWAGPIELFGALASEPTLVDLEIDRIVIEEQTGFDNYAGPRNHDLLIVGTANGGRVLVAVEAKAGETLGQTVSEYRRAAMSKRDKGDSTNAPERLDELLRTFGLNTRVPETVGSLRYQLFSALAGTLAAASEHQADQAVLLVHDFITDVRQPQGGEDLRRFADAVWNCVLPLDSELPWCAKVGQSEGSYGFTGPIYLAHAISDLRSPRARVD